MDSFDIIIITLVAVITLLPKMMMKSKKRSRTLPRNIGSKPNMEPVSAGKSLREILEEANQEANKEIRKASSTIPGALETLFPNLPLEQHEPKKKKKKKAKQATAPMENPVIKEEISKEEKKTGSLEEQLKEQTSHKEFSLEDAIIYDTILNRPYED